MNLLTYKNDITVSKQSSVLQRIEDAVKNQHCWVQRLQSIVGKFHILFGIALN